MFIVKLLYTKFFYLVAFNSHMAVFGKSKNADIRKNLLVFL